VRSTKTPNFNLLGRFEFHKQQSVINIDEMISENRMAATESNRRSASLKISALPFCGDSQKHPIYSVDLNFIGSNMAIFEQTPGKVKQDKDFSQESKHKERSIASFNEFLTISWQYVNLLSRFEFHKQHSVINIDEMICLLEQKIV
jgi:hypothetical protein